MSEPLISLCLPTYGMAEWVFPVLESIYSQGVSNELFEVIVTDNGTNDAFQARMEEYAGAHPNLTYRKTTAFQFHNQLEALKLAKGQYLKFVNHRTTMTPGSLERMVSIIREHLEDRAVIYFSCGKLKQGYDGDSFDGFVGALGVRASWTNGVGIWKTDYEQIPADTKVDKISPHSFILFAVRKDRRFIINNEVLFEELETDPTKKGHYDLFKAFAVEEIAITQNLFIDGDITADTFKKVKAEYKKFVIDLYQYFCIRKHPCSYDLTGFEDAMGFYFRRGEIVRGAYWLLVKKTLGKIVGR